MEDVTQCQFQAFGDQILKSRQINSLDCFYCAYCSMFIKPTNSHTHCSLSRLLSQHHRIWINKPKSINNDFTFHRLHWINDNCDRSIRQSFKTLLSIDIDSGQPAAETWMTMVPSDNHFWSASLFQHIQHFRLKNRVDRFDRNACSGLRHGKHVDDFYGLRGRKLGGGWITLILIVK